MSLWLALVGCGEPAVDETAAPDAPLVLTLPASPVLVDTPVTLSVGVDDAVWDFGDGQSAEGASVTHTWTRGGRFQLRVEASGQAVTEGVQVSWAPGEVANASRLAVTEDWVAAAVPDAGALVLWQRDDLSAPWLDNRDVCGEPLSVSPGIDTDWVVACGDDQVVFVDGGGAVVHRVPTPRGSRPSAVLVHEGAAWASLAGTGALIRVSASGIDASIPVVAEPRGLASANGTLWTASFRSRDGVARAASVTGESVERVELPRDPGPDSDTDSRGLPNLLGSVWATPDGQAVYVSGLKANTERGLFNEGTAFTHDTTARAVSRPIGRGVEPRFDDRDRVTATTGSADGRTLFLATGTGHVDVVERDTGIRVGAVLDVGTAPDAVHWEAGELWVLSTLDRTLRVFDVSDLAAPQREVASVPLLSAPDPVDPVVLRGKQLFHDAGDPRMSQVGYISCGSCHPNGEDDGLTWDFTERGEGLRNTHSLQTRAGMGHGLLHWSANFDEVQDFEADIRLFQGGVGYLSDADFADTEASLGAPKAGLSDDLDALAAYVSSLAAAPVSPHPVDDAAIRGEALFDSAGCADCHPAPAFTISAAPGPVLIDVGTLTAASGSRLGGPLDGLDVPTLRGVWATPPYLHDGSAATLEDLLQRDTDGRHGPAMSPEDAADLAAFLRTLE